MWDEIFTWRSHMFNAITSNFSWSEPSTLAALHDRPWSSIRMAMTARKQNMRQVRQESYSPYAHPINLTLVGARPLCCY